MAWSRLGLGRRRRRSRHRSGPCRNDTMGMGRIRISSLRRLWLSLRRRRLGLRRALLSRPAADLDTLGLALAAGSSVLNHSANGDCDLTASWRQKSVNTQLAAMFAVFRSGCGIAM